MTTTAAAATAVVVVMAGAGGGEAESPGRPLVNAFTTFVPALTPPRPRVGGRPHHHHHHHHQREQQQQLHVRHRSDITNSPRMVASIAPSTPIPLSSSSSTVLSPLSVFVPAAIRYHSSTPVDTLPGFASATTTTTIPLPASSSSLDFTSSSSTVIELESDQEMKPVVPPMMTTMRRCSVSTPNLHITVHRSPTPPIVVFESSLLLPPRITITAADDAAARNDGSGDGDDDDNDDRVSPIMQSPPYSPLVALSTSPSMSPPDRNNSVHGELHTIAAADRSLPPLRHPKIWPFVVIPNELK